MSAEIVPLFPRHPAADAWDEYCALVRERNADERLMLDLAHCQRTMLAWKRWSDLFLETAGAA